MLPENLAANIDLDALVNAKNVDPLARDIFAWLQSEGSIASQEMLRTFNCGVGMVLVVAPEQLDDVLEALMPVNERPFHSRPAC